MNEVATNWAAAPRKTVRTRIIKALRDADWKVSKYDRTKRLRDVLGDIDGRDWGHKLMALTGRKYGGTYDVPHAPDLYIRFGHERDENRRVIEKGEYVEPFVTTHAMTAWDGVKRGEEWRTFDWQDDGFTLRVGWLGDDGRIHDSGIGAYSGELKMFRKWFIWDSWIKYDWFGLRRWIYYKGLHMAVHEKKRFACHAIPPRNSGGYDHWHCQVPVGVIGMIRRRLNQPVTHPGPHIFRRMSWFEDGRVLHTSDQSGNK